MNFKTEAKIFTRVLYLFILKFRGYALKFPLSLSLSLCFILVIVVRRSSQSLSLSLYLFSTARFFRLPAKFLGFVASDSMP